MSRVNNTDHNESPIDLVLHIVGSRWTIAIVREMAKGPKRPSELARILKSVSAKTLTQRLRDLEQWGLVTREAYQEIPPRVVYALTERGRDLLFVLEALKDMGESWQRAFNISIPPEFKEKCNHCFDHESHPSSSEISSELRELASDIRVNPD